MDTTQASDPQQSPPPQQPAQPSQPQPVRYIAVDANGHPLPNQPAFTPPSEAQAANPQLVYMSRPLDPAEMQMSPEVKQRHEESKRKFPALNLSEGEYIISSVRRHPIGLFSIWGIAGFVVAFLLAGLAAYGTFAQNAQSALDVGGSSSPAFGVVAIAVLILVFIVLLGSYIGTIVYQGNRFYLTNESVIQEIQNSLFDKREQTVSLGNIEDASYTQRGILQAMVGYGSIRLSTQGDETTYRFSFVTNPKEQIAILNNAVEAFKNGRRVEG